MVKKTVKSTKKSAAKTTAVKKSVSRAKTSKKPTIIKGFRPELMMWLVVALGVSSMLLFALLTKMNLGP